LYNRNWVKLLNLVESPNYRFKYKGCVNGKYLLKKLVDLCGRRETPAGGRDRGDLAGALAPRRLPEPPAESEAPGAQINSQVLTQPI
jgi:hypothetical protein